jgi:hypothetical protein
VQLNTHFSPKIDIDLDGQHYTLMEGTQSFWINKEDAEKLEAGKVVRLRNAYLVKITQKNEQQVNAEFVSTKILEKATQINWVLKGIEASITMPDNTTVVGIADDRIKQYPVDKEVYLHHLGFCRNDSLSEAKAGLWFTHE